MSETASRDARPPGFYAEDGLDRYIREAFFRDRQRGTMIEVGAAGPTYLSMSRHFRESAWRVIAIEPNPYFVEQHAAEGFSVLRYACGEHDADDVDFEIVHQPAAYAGGQVSYESFSALKVRDSYRALNPSIQTQRIKVRVRRLDTILKEHAPDVRRIDLLSIDVEGWELQVLEGFALKRFSPRVVVIENLLSDPAYPQYMARRGYRLHATRPPNQIYVRLPWPLAMAARLKRFCAKPMRGRA